MDRWDRWAEKEQRRGELESDASFRLFGAGGFAHVTSVLLPLLGPAAAVALARQDAFQRRHALAAVVLNVCVLVLAVLVEAVAGGHGWALALQALVVVTWIGGATGNIRRLKRHEPPLTGW